MSKTKEFVKKGLLAIGYELKKKRSLVATPIKTRIIESFVSNGSQPWSYGYNEFKEEQILSVLENQTIMKKFLNQDQLPISFGKGIDERIVEYPWFFSNAEILPEQHLHYLDAGPVMNHEFIVDRAIKLSKNVHFTTLSHEKNCFQNLDISYLFADLVSLPVKDDFYDLISCISTLEHVGCNNECYGSKGTSLSENQKDFTYLDAAKELFRVLKPGGTLYITVPFGRYMHLGMIQQFDNEMLKKLLQVFARTTNKCDFFKYTSRGWQKSNQEECKDVIFVKWLPTSLINEAFPKPHPVEKDQAAAARAVCCITVTKR